MIRNPDRLAALPTIEDVTRRQFMSSALAAALLIACGGDDEPDAAPSASSRQISSKFGTYEIPTDPKRLLLMGNRFDLETAVALGLTPMAIGREYAFTGGASNYVAPWVPFQAPQASSIQVFEAGEADIEQMLLLRPDLIFCQGYHLENTQRYRAFNTLKEVAPILPTNLLSWREDLQQVAQWLQRESQLTAAFKQYDDLLGSIKSKHAGRISRAKVAVGYPDENSFWLLSTRAGDWPTVNTLNDLGGSTVDLPEDAQNPGWSQISYENLRLLNGADALLIYNTDEISRAKLEGHPLWPLLEPVKNKRVVISANNVGTGSVYTHAECLRLWDRTYSVLS